MPETVQQPCTEVLNTPGRRRHTPLAGDVHACVSAWPPAFDRAAHAADTHGGDEMANVHKAYRLPTELVEQVEAWAQEQGVGQAEAVRRLLAAGLEASEGRQAEADDLRESLEAEREAHRELVATLREHVVDLKAQVARMAAQAADRDEQVNRALGIAERAQALQFQQAQSHALRAANERRPTFLERWRSRWSDEGSE